MDDGLRQSLFDPDAAHDLVLAHRPPLPSAVQGVVSDAVWGEVVRLLRWATADTGGSDALAFGTWWRLAAGCAAFLRRYPGLSAELAEPWDVVAAPELPGEGAERVTAAAERLAALLHAPHPLPLRRLAAEVDALGAAAIGALAARAWAPVQRRGGTAIRSRSAATTISPPKRAAASSRNRAVSR